MSRLDFPTAPMVLASHAIFAARGFWLPNDPRGSWSDFVAAWELVLAGGKATKTDERRSLANDEHNVEARLAVKDALKYPPVTFDGRQALAIANGFQLAVEESEYKLYACSILERHVHVVAGRTDRKVERIVGHMKTRATQRLKAVGRHPLDAFRRDDNSPPSPWGERCWKVFLDSIDDVHRAIEYVEENPLKEGKKRQTWSFVVPFVPW